MFTQNSVCNIKIPTHVEFFIYRLAKIRMLVLSTVSGCKYFVVPNFVSLSRNLSSLELAFDCFASLSLQQSFLLEINAWLRSIEKLCRRKLFFKGLGFRAKLAENKSRLVLKLGFSHLLRVKIPTNAIKIRVSKSTVTVKGHDKTEVGNFARKVRSIRIPDVYKGKGIWYKYESKTLKELKKK
jgi:large subunit ribosomal protein L6